MAIVKDSQTKMRELAAQKMGVKLPTTTAPVQTTTEPTLNTPDYSSLKNVSGTIETTEGQKFATPEQLSGYLKVPTTEIDWSKIATPTTQTTTPTITTPTATTVTTPTTTSQLSAIQKRLLEAQTPTAEEAKLTTEYNDLASRIQQENLAAQAGISSLEGQGRGITTSLIRGQQAKLQEQANLNLQTLQSQLANIQANIQAKQSQRQAAADLATTELDIEKYRIQQEEAATEKAQEQAQTFLSTLSGINPETYSVTAKARLSKIAQDLGLDQTDLMNALQLQYDTKDLDTTITEVGGRKVLLNTQTGETIKDLGEADSSINNSLREIGGRTVLINNDTGEIIRDYGTTDETEIDQDLIDRTSNATADQIANAIKQVESGGNYSASGASGESGAYQFMPKTWAEWSSQYANQVLQRSEVLPMTAENQDAVAKWKIQQWLNQGYNAQQIASMWNSGSPTWEGKTGVNSAGVAYDVPSYVNKITTALSRGIEQIAGEYFSDSQLAKGAYNAGMTINEFRKLGIDEANKYINTTDEDEAMLDNWLNQ